MRLDILIPVLLYEIIIIFGVGFYISKKNAGKKDEEGNFALGGRNMGVLTLAVTMALTVLGSAHVLGTMEMTFGMGAVAIWFSLAHVLLVVVACFGTGVWVRRLGVTTVPEAIKGMYGSGVAAAIAAVMSGTIWGILTLETQGLGIILNALTGWPIAIGCVVGGILGVFYVALAGMEEVGIVNVVNAIIMYIGLILATIFIAGGLPGGNFESVREYYMANNGFPGPDHGGHEPAAYINILGDSGLFIGFAIVQVITVVFSQSITQQLMQCCISAKNEKTIKRAVWIAAPVNGLFGAFIITIALTAKAFPVINPADPDFAKRFGMAYLVEHVPGVVAVFLLAALLAAVLSTFAMTTLTPATIFATDIYKRYFNPKAPEKKVAQIIRIMIVVLGAFAVAISTFLPNIVGAINWLFAWMVPVFWLFVAGCFWKRHRGVAFVTLIVTWVVNLLWTFVVQNASLHEVPTTGLFSLANGYITLITTLVCLVVGNLAVGDKAEPGYFRVPEAERKVLEGRA
jgi:SSS family solute:Na+ symporter